MRASLAAIFAGLGLLVMVAPAHAGSYAVWACGAPGAGGQNHSWTPDNAFPLSYDTSSGCDLTVASKNVDNAAAPFFSGAGWTFQAPSGTVADRLVVWRRGYYFGSGWTVGGYNADGSLIGGPFGETCYVPQGALLCEFGKYGGVSQESRAEYDVETAKIRYAVSCFRDPECRPTRGNGIPLASLSLYGAVVTLRDDQRPSLRLRANGLLGGGWRRPGEVLGYDASDNAGIRAVRVEAAGARRRDAKACDFTRPVPCGNLTGATIGVGLGDGTQAVRVVAEDAAGNETAVSRQVQVDGTAPSARLESTRGRSIRVAVRTRRRAWPAGRSRRGPVTRRSGHSTRGCAAAGWSRASRGGGRRGPTSG